MYDIGDNDAVFTEMKQRHEQRKQKHEQRLQSLFFVMPQLKESIRKIKESVKKIKETGRTDPQDMQFTGKMTDIAGLDGMKCSDVKNHMPNEEVYESTKENIYSAQKDGYIDIDKNNVIHLTDKGKELTQSEQFMKQFEKDQFDAKFDDVQAQNPNEQIAYCEFNGTEQDMGVFNYTEQVDLNSVQDGSGKEAVVNNFTTLEKQGMVNINNGVVTPTEKGLDFAKSQSFSVKPASRDEMQSVFSSAGKNAAEKSGISKVGGQAANAAANTGGKAAANTAAKAASGAAKSAVSGAAKGAAGAAAGAATAGIGAAVVVAVEVIKKLQQAKNALKQSLNSSVNQTPQK